MAWVAIAIYGALGLALAASPQSFFRPGGAGRDARLIRGYQAFGTVILHLAALLAFAKLAGTLAHCRIEEPHARRCWVVDLVRGNE
jgi:hypothetical protein